MRTYPKFDVAGITCTRNQRMSVARHMFAALLCVAGAIGWGQGVGWAWISGGQAPDPQMHVGTIGVPGEDNSPGARTGASTWIGPDGNLWLFGGELHSAEESGEKNDMWMYDRGLHEWVCESTGTVYKIGHYTGGGDPGTEYHPGARYGAMSWLGDDGSVWIFGGTGFDKTGPQAKLNDLWKYDPTTKAWAWMKGSDRAASSGVYGTQGTGEVANTPGARVNSVTWKDSDGNLWLLGGNGFAGNAEGSLNDVWKYDVAANQWIWMKGNAQPNMPAVVGVQGVANVTNTPGGLNGAVGWTDADGNVWVYGGLYKSDLWKYSMVTNQWTFMKGANEEHVDPVYGTQGVADAANTPGARFLSSGWSDGSGTLWLYDGATQNGTGNNLEPASDLWKLNRSTLEWTWVGGGGPNEFIPSTYGTQGTAADTNFPGVRNGAITWGDNSGNLWVFAGAIYTDVDSVKFAQDVWNFDSDTNMWTWTAGDKIESEAGSYGSIKIPSAANTPGARVDAVALTAADQKLWLFGGTGADADGDVGFLNDLWSYDPMTMRWTWMKGNDTRNDNGWYGQKGQTHSVYTPGGRRNGVGWVDHDGNIWIFGGETYRTLDATRWDDILRNDLWKFDVATNNWTFMHGGQYNQDPAVFGALGELNAENVPGAREGAVAWVDNAGDLWLFGGWGTTDEDRSPKTLNDLWKFDIDLNQWAWMGGTKLKNEHGEYGSMGVAGNGNMPGARQDSIAWTDADGNFWLFGGEGYGESGFKGMLSDLWKFDPQAGQWTWMHGSKRTGAGGEYGTMGVGNPANVPGARANGSAWTGPDGNLYLYGGDGMILRAHWPGPLGDLWKYDIAANQWTWIGGSNQEDPLPMYGPRYEITNDSNPGGRAQGVAWGLADGAVWYFGGRSVNYSPLNDLWKLGEAAVVPTSAADWQLFE